VKYQTGPNADCLCLFFSYNHEAMGGYIRSKEHERGTHHSGGTLAPRSKREVQPKLWHGLIVLWFGAARWEIKGEGCLYSAKYCEYSLPLLLKLFPTVAMATGPLGE
jgi:hypothetical protein